MKHSLLQMKTTACLLIVALLSLSVSLPVAQARMIDTGMALAQEQPMGDRGRLQAFLDREDVQGVLTAQGIAPAEAKARVAALTDDEVRQAVGQLDQLPAGGSAVGVIVGAAVLIFIVLLITDILGVTRVFPFTRSISAR